MRTRDGQEKDLKRALKLFLDAGERGSADAMCSAGAMIYNGEGQEKDLKKAFEVYTQAASLGSLAAIKNVGERRRFNSRSPRCIWWAREWRRIRRRRRT